MEDFNKNIKIVLKNINAYKLIFFLNNRDIYERNKVIYEALRNLGPRYTSKPKPETLEERERRKAVRDYLNELDEFEKRSRKVRLVARVSAI